MIIPVLQQLNSRDQWMAFCRRELPYCFIETPECLVDFQTTFLKITVLPKETLIHDAVKYSLGSRNSMEPVWRLIKGCNWDLGAILAGLEQMEFGSNVRDNSLLKVHTDLSVRKYFSRERGLVSPASLGLLPPLLSAPDIWHAQAVAQMISHQQFSDLRNEVKALPGKQSIAGAPPPSLSSIMMILLDPIEQCIGQMHKERLHIFRGKQPFISLIPKLSKPKPRLKSTT